VFSFDWTPTAEGQTNAALMGSYTDASNWLDIYAGASLFIRKTVSGTTTSIAPSLTHVAGTTYTIKFRMDSALGMDGWINDVKATGDSNTDDAVLSSEFDIGHLNGISQQTGGINNFTVHKGSFTDAEVVAL